MAHLMWVLVAILIIAGLLGLGGGSHAVASLFLIILVIAIVFRMTHIRRATQSLESCLVATDGDSLTVKT